MTSFVHLVADYGKSDPAFSEVVHRLRAAAPDVTVQPTAVPPFSTVATGFWIAQLGLHNPPFDGLAVYSNTAPRIEDAETGRSGDGGDLCYLELETGVPVVAVDTGYNLSFVRDRVETFREVEVPDDDSQFRSRDHFPERVAALLAGDDSALGAERSPEDVPEKPDAAVCHVDGYGNVKTSIRASEFDDADAVTVTLNGQRHETTYRDTVSAVDQDALGLVPGSAGGEDPFLELFVRGGSAAERFDEPEPGDELTIE